MHTKILYKKGTKDKIITSRSDGYILCVTRDTSYQINGGNVGVGSVVASLDKNTLSADLTFSRTTTIAPTYAGTHSEVLTFNVSVTTS